MILNTIQIDAILPDVLPTDHQALMNLFYDKNWQRLSAVVRAHNEAVLARAKADGADISLAGIDSLDPVIYDFLRDPSQAEIAATMPAKVNAAVVLGNFNYQVCNGGFMQWRDNGYSDSFDELRKLLEAGAVLGIEHAADILQMAEDFLRRVRSEESANRNHDDEDAGDYNDPHLDEDLCTRYYVIDAEPMMQAILDRFDEVCSYNVGRFLKRKAA